MPAGGFFTITPERAAAYVTQLNPRIAILMHYRTALGGPAQLGTLPSTAAPFSPLVYEPSTVVVNREALPASTEVWVLQPASDAAVVNAATFAGGHPVAPGSIVSVFGTFGASRTAAAAAYPLPRKIGETEVLIDRQSGAVVLRIANADQSASPGRTGGRTAARGCACERAVRGPRPLYGDPVGARAVRGGQSRLSDELAEPSRSSRRDSSNLWDRTGRRGARGRRWRSHPGGASGALRSAQRLSGRAATHGSVQRPRSGIGRSLADQCGTANRCAHRAIAIADGRQWPVTSNRLPVAITK
jgi:hypothetical protein